jgi:coenzyme PQQ precursor peptide PqqA
MWTTPSAQEMRFGFEVTMYVMNKKYIFYILVYFLYFHYLEAV